MSSIFSASSGTRSVLDADLVELLAADARQAAPRLPALHGPAFRADPRLEHPEVLLALLVGLAEVAVHVAGLAAGALAVVEPAHQRARVRPADVVDQVGVAVHARALLFPGELLLVFLELAVVGRVRAAVALGALLVEERFDVLAVGHVLRQGAGARAGERNGEPCPKVCFHFAAPWESEYT